MTTGLFSPLTSHGLSLPNRIAVAPMCQYSADDGVANDWHLQHWMSLGMSGAGMITLEATGVERRGRITHGCLGLYSDDCEAAIASRLRAARRVAPKGTAFGIQLAHAGRKASAQRPWEGGGPLKDNEDPWTTVSASAIAFGEGWHVPQALTEDGIATVIRAFARAAQRAERLGFDFVELHGAHGYLAHQFLSPLSNKRNDQWGGSLENRMRFLLSMLKEVKASVSPRLAVAARISATDWMDGGFNPDEAVKLAGALKACGLAYLCVSSGGIHPAAKVPAGPSYQVPFAERIRRETRIVTRAVGMIDDPKVAEEIVNSGKADIVALARGILADPRWPWRAAKRLGSEIEIVPQYARSAAFVR